MGISDTVGAINFGKLIAVGTPKQIQENETVRLAYLGSD
jgi:branched-chain amino acid transport system ATP-binding protein